MKKNLMNKLNQKGKEVKKMKKVKLLSLTVLMITALFVIPGTNANAGPMIGLDPTGLSSYSSYADIWTSITDTALSTGFDPTKVVIGGVGAYSTDFILQGRIGTTSKLGVPNTPVGLNAPGSGFQMTFVTEFPETVTNEFTLGGTSFATFAGGPSLSPDLFVYLDSYGAGAPADPNGVSGYQLGNLILTATLQNETGSFSAPSGSNPLLTGSFNGQFLIDSVDANYLDVTSGPGSVFDIEATGTLNIPTFYDPTTMWNGTLTSTGVPLKYDGSASFSVSGIPEPSTLLLLGIGLLGLGAYGRKRFKA